MALTEEIAKKAKEASIKLSALTEEKKNSALKAIANALEKKIDQIIEANNKDLELSQKGGLASPLLKRLNYNRSKIETTIEGIKSLINLPDPVGQTLMSSELDDELTLYKVTCPIGLIGVIFESRPDALVQISTLCLKSGNAVMLKGGSEAANTNKILTQIIEEATLNCDIPEGWIQLLETRADVNEMLKMDKYIDLIIPRGSNEFVQYIMQNSNIPVLGHADGICHVYVDKDADINMAINITIDSKTQYVAVCNAAETLLVHCDIAPNFLPKLKVALEKHSVLIKGCQKTQKIINVEPATEKDWETEYLDYILSIKVVSNIDEAIDHINRYGSGHTDTIVTKSKNAAKKFMDLVDSADVFWNASTRFSDGFRYGLGAEVGISTNKIHARGPVGLEGLIIYKWKLIGNGHVVDDYATGKRKFKHKKIDEKFPLS